MFLQDTQLYGRTGAPQLTTPILGGGTVEEISFKGAGMTFQLEVRTGAPLKLAAAAAPIEYILRVDTKPLQPDHRNPRLFLNNDGSPKHPGLPRSPSGLSDQVSVARWRHASTTASGSLDWKPEVVVEYELRFTPAGEGGLSEPVVTYHRFSDFIALHTELVTCYGSMKMAASLPKPPKKTWSVTSSKKSEKFNHERQKDLDRYMKQLCCNARGTTLPYLLLFLGIWDQAKIDAALPDTEGAQPGGADGLTTDDRGVTTHSHGCVYHNEAADGMAFERPSALLDAPPEGVPPQPHQVSGQKQSQPAAAAPAAIDSLFGDEDEDEDEEDDEDEDELFGGSSAPDPDPDPDPEPEPEPVADVDGGGLFGDEEEDEDDDGEWM